MVGRRLELELLAYVVGRLPDGLTACSLTGPAGMGKTTLWRCAGSLAREAGHVVLSTRATAAEARLSYAGLADLLEGVPPARLLDLPEVQRQALEVALLRREAGAGGIDARLVGTGLLSVFRALAGSAPVVIGVDDVQWLDKASSSALAFALRRLETAPIVAVVSLRLDHGSARPRTFLDSMPAERRSEIGLAPLSLASVHAILQAELGWAPARPTLVRLVAECGGNPLYALEIARELDRLGRPAGVDALPVPKDLEQLLLGRLRRLPEHTGSELLKLACLGTATTSLVDEEALEPAERAGIVRIDAGGRVAFSHPLYATALHDAAPAADRRAVHRRLATRVTDDESRARHLALGSAGPDPETAAELDVAARRAAGRGAPDAAAELAELALRCTPEDDLPARLRRRVAYGNLVYSAGDLTAALEAFETACADAPRGDDRTRALIDLGAIVTAAGDQARGAALIDEAIADVDDPALAAEAHARRAWISHLDLPLVIRHSRAVLDLVAEDEQPGLYSFAQQQLAFALLCTGETAAHDLIESSLRGQRRAETWTISSVGPRWPMYFDDFATARERHLDLIARAAERGNEPERQSELVYLALIELWWGRPAEAEALARDALALADQIEQEPMACVSRYALGLVVAQSGRLDEAEALAERSLAWIDGVSKEPAFVLRAQTHALLGFVAFSRGELDEADRRFSLAEEAVTAWEEPAPFRFHADQAEAAIRLGRLDRAERLVAGLERRAARIPRPWIRAVAARCRGLLCAALGDLDAGAAELERALDEHAALEMPFERGRTLLCLGEVRRRRKEKRLARLALEEAASLFDSVDASVFAGRARDELERVATRRAPTRLTATERRIAELAAAGLTNRAIADRVFVSINTVEANLKRTYRKLGIARRAQLARALDEATAPIP